MPANQIAALEFVDCIDSLGSADEVWNAFLAFAARCGMLFGVLCDIPAMDEDVRDTLLYLSWPDGWSEHYIAQDYIRRDPVVLELSQTPEPYSWRELLQNPSYTPDQRRIFDEARDFGMNSGLVVPILGPHAGLTVISLGGPAKTFSTRERAELQFAALYAHARIRALPPHKRKPRVLPPLTARERECLAWAATGKSDWEIGEILSISEKTANAHIERVKAKYGVPTRVQAIVLACRNGVIAA